MYLILNFTTKPLNQSKMKTAAILFVMAATTVLFWWGVWHWFEWVGVYIALAWTAIMLIIYKIKAKRNEDLEDHI